MLAKIKNLTIGSLLTIGVTSIIGLIISATIYSNYLTTHAQDIISRSTTRIFDLLTIQRDTDELFSALNDIDVIYDSASLAREKEKINGLSQRAQETIDRGEKEGIFEKQEAERAREILDSVSISLDKTFDLKEEIIARGVGGSDQINQQYDKREELDRELTELRNVHYQIQELVFNVIQRSDEEYRGAMELVQRAAVITWVVIGISLVLSVFLAVFLIRSTKKIFDLKNEFVNIIAHDLRNPVTAIIGYLDMSLKDSKGSKEKLLENIKTIGISTQKLKMQINSLLEVGRMEAGRLKINLEALDPFEVIEESITRALAFAEMSEVTINFDKKDRKSVRISADRNKLSDVLDNLISNAIKYNKKDGKVTVATKDEGEKFSISVSDEGKGIPENQKDKLFKKYSRLDTEKEKGVQGTGLGLYTVKLDMDQMKGTVSYQTVEGKGTTFTVTFNKAKES